MTPKRLLHYAHKAYEIADHAHHTGQHDLFIRANELINRIFRTLKNQRPELF